MKFSNDVVQKHSPRAYEVKESTSPVVVFPSSSLSINSFREKKSR